MRPWIAIVAAYALALQVLLTGIAAGHVMAVGDASTGDLFVICHGGGDNSSDSGDLPDKLPLPRSPCVLCTLADGPSTILPTHHGIATVDALMVSNVVPRNDGRIIGFDSPTGQYQRGPPASVFVFG
jgi:hypothetical protein